MRIISLPPSYIGLEYVCRMSKVDNTADDAKKLAMRCKALEAQLRQSITKKEHHEIVLEFEQKMTDMERRISEQETKVVEAAKEAARTKAELQKANVVNRQLDIVGEQIATLNRIVVNQGKTVDSLVSRLSQGTIPTSVHQQSLARLQELEEKSKGMVNRSEYAALEARCEEAKQQIAGMVPAADYDALKQNAGELENLVSTMVPREQLVSTEARVKELEARLSEHVPQSTYDELVSKVVQLAEEVTGGEPVKMVQESARTSTIEAKPQVAAQEVAAETLPDTQVQPPSAPEVIASPEQVAPETTVAAPAVAEITEVGSQLAEISTDKLAGALLGVSPEGEAETKSPESSDTVPEETTNAQPHDEASVVVEANGETSVQSS